MSRVSRFEKIDESKLFLYFACSDGYILRVLKSNYHEEKVAIYQHKGRVCCKVNQKTIAVKKLIAKAFIYNYRNGDIIENIDGNPFNCALDNLRIITKRELGIRTGGRGNNIPVMVTAPNGKKAEYPSIRSAAQALFVSHQTLNEVLNGTRKNTVLNGYEIKKMEVTT